MTRTEHHPPQPGVRYVRADVTDRPSLIDALRGCDTVIHAVSYTGPDEQRCRAVNLTGTVNVLAAADTLGINRIVTVSTIGVYGPGPFRGIAEDEREPHPVTALSVTRAAADRLARDRGATTVLPGFVHGPGDRWFAPGLRHLLGTLGAWVDDGTARLSTIAVDELGALIAYLAYTATDADRGALFHAADPTARTVRELAMWLSGKDFRPPTESCTYADALVRAAGVGLTARQVDLIGRDHTLDGTRLRQRLYGTTRGGPTQTASNSHCTLRSSSSGEPERW